MALEKQPKMEASLLIRVTKRKENEIRTLCDSKNWNVSAFIRQAIDESIERVSEEQTQFDEATGD